MIWKFFIFFSRLFFPILCYGCRFPGKVLCRHCIEALRMHSSTGRCPHCFSLLGLEEASTCDQCLSSFSRKSFHLYSPVPEALNLYSQACRGKKFAIGFFARGIRKEWEWNQVVPTKIFYIISKISKECVKKLHQDTGIPYQGILPIKYFLQSLTKYVKKGPICILSAYPLPREWQNMIERYAPQPVILISLFVDPREGPK